MPRIDSVPLSRSSQLLTANATPRPQESPWSFQADGDAEGNGGQASHPQIHMVG